MILKYSLWHSGMYTHSTFWALPPVNLSHFNWIISPVKRTWKVEESYFLYSTPTKEIIFNKTIDNI